MQGTCSICIRRRLLFICYARCTLSHKKILLTLRRLQS